MRELGFMVLAFTIFMAPFTIGNMIYSNSTVHELTSMTVTEKQRECRSQNNCSYLIYTEDAAGNVRVLENKDSWPHFKFNSSDVYAEIDEGSTYDFTVYGQRVHFLSWYENIIGVEEVAVANE